MRITYSRKVRFSDIDCQGHVFNANYFVYVDDALTDYTDAVGLRYEELRRRGHDMVLARAECDYRSSGLLGETLVTAVSVEKLGNTSITFSFHMTEEETGRTIAQGREIYVIIDLSNGRPTAVPDYVRAALAEASASRV
ncbi:MAG: acyl-CoA thioesterase [Deltaproteobacteria bacterium]|nr:acyl-CoA thioesterase [Deltaproteobacteria bacterium]